MTRRHTTTLRTLTLRTRLLAGIGVVAIVLVVVSALVTATIRDQLVEQVDDRLTLFSSGTSERLPHAEPDDHDDHDDRDDEPIFDPRRDRSSDVYEGYVGADGTLVTRFAPNVGDRAFVPPAISSDDLPETGSRRFTVGAGDDGVTFRVNAVRVDDATVAVVAIPLDDVERTIGRLVLVEVLGSLAILATLGLVGWWVIRLGIRPVKEMTAAATRIADGDLDERVPEAPPGTEPGELSLALNRMLVRIGDALDERAASEARLRQFVADASHELRTPITTIRGYAELYRHGGLAASDALDDAMRRTEQEASRMGRLVEDMLTLAKLDEQRPLANGPVDLARLAEDAAADARAVDPDRDVAVRIDSGGPARVTGDEDRLRQILANIVGNALVHTDAAIEIAVETDAANATVSVRDHGPGMPPEVAERVTERFFRADPARTRSRGGSGLGLSIVDATAAAHGGTVEVDSTVGSGTTIRVVLPLEAPASSATSGDNLPN